MAAVHYEFSMTKKIKKARTKLIIGWREWCGLPELGLPGIVAKIDTGAKTSSLHAFKIRHFEKDGESWVRFIVHPAQRRRQPEITCEAKVIDERTITSSNGASEQRIVISTTMILGQQKFETELTLSNRDEMGFRMLVGRQSLSRRFMVDPSLSFAAGDYDDKDQALFSAKPLNAAAN